MNNQLVEALQYDGERLIRLVRFVQGYTYQRSIGPLENTPDISSWDVILASVLDETKIGNLNSIIHSNNAVVVSLLKDDSTFIQELFARIRSPSTSEESEKILNYNPINPRNDPKYNLPLTNVVRGQARGSKFHLSYFMVIRTIIERRYEELNIVGPREKASL
ncbi:hypothetical protein F8388_011815 [Cannabis sativa]|uniref:Serine/threonine-protein phosphatase 4 regulatory subunit 3-like central domain-containing protein n=1 Tax=Cannabis sativa TaxID=3483 RepID=A0A7J6FJE5_CANSA|nr:hypothetical protein F8388_011815 [Cannabis sativa]